MCRPPERATSECATSCITTDPKNASAVSALTTQTAVIGTPGIISGNWDASDHVTSTKIGNQLTLTSSGMPKMRPSLTDGRSNNVITSWRA
jgi:hypothetical protein